MTNLRRTLILGCCISLLGMGQHSLGQTPYFELVPSKAIVEVGEEFQVSVWARGLGNQQSPSVIQFITGVYYDVGFVQVLGLPDGHGNLTIPKVDYHWDQLYPAALHPVDITELFFLFHGFSGGSASVAVSYGTAAGFDGQQWDTQDLHPHQSGDVKLFTMYVKAMAQTGPSGTDMTFGNALGATPPTMTVADNGTVRDYTWTDPSALPGANIVVVPEPALAWVPGALLLGGLVAWRIRRRVG